MFQDNLEFSNVMSEHHFRTSSHAVPTGHFKFKITEKNVYTYKIDKNNNKERNCTISCEKTPFRLTAVNSKWKTEVENI